jgi:hypothetical protein
MWSITINRGGKKMKKQIWFTSFLSLTVFLLLIGCGSVNETTELKADRD